MSLKRQQASVGIHLLGIDLGELLSSLVVEYRAVTHPNYTYMILGTAEIDT